MNKLENKNRQNRVPLSPQKLSSKFLIFKEFRTFSFIKAAPKMHRNTIITS